MLRKRSRPSHNDLSKDLGKPDFDRKSFPSFTGNKSMPIFNVPGLFDGLHGKSQSDSDSAKSPTSPLDWKSFGSLLNPLASPRRGSSCLQRSWNCDRVGLGLADCLKDEPASSKNFLGVLKNCNVSCGFEKSISNLCKGSSNTTTLTITNPLSEDDAKFNHSEAIAIVPAPLALSSFPNSNQSSGSLPYLVYCNPTPNSDSFPASDAKGELKLGDFSGQPSSLPVSVLSSHGLCGSLSTKEIEESEDYTRITSHGPNPKTTHIFGDCILERHTIELSDENREHWIVGFPCPNPNYPLNNFLNTCFSCKKKLEDGNDIYIYRYVQACVCPAKQGEKAFCSSDCRAHEILNEEELDDHELPLNSPCSGNDNGIPTDGYCFKA